MLRMALDEPNQILFSDVGQISEIGLGEPFKGTGPRGGVELAMLLGHVGVTQATGAEMEARRAPIPLMSISQSGQW